MKHNLILTIASLLSILFFTLHLTDDIVRGMEPGGLSNLIGGVLISVVWLYATLVLADRWWGLVLLLLMSIGGAAVPYLHMSKGLAGGRIAGTSGMFFWVWTLLALGVTSMFAVVMSALGLWNLRKARS